MVSLSVVYLFWEKSSFESFKNFINSYSLQSVNYQVEIYFKGDSQSFEDHKNYLSLNKINHSIHFIESEGLDIHSYFNIANISKTKYILFFNSNSILLYKNVLQNYISVLENLGENAGIIGATASRGNILNTFLISIIFYIFNFDLKKLFESFLGTLIYYKNFSITKTFSIRTNAFIVNREVFLSYPNHIYKTKKKCYEFESGINSITNFFLEKKFAVKFIDKNCQIFDKENCKLSNVFWKQNQENLLVSDNQTRLYNDASLKEKQFYSKIAWGQ